MPYTAVSDYLTVPAGAHNVQVTATGSADPVIDADLTLTAGTSYTVAATGLVADIAATVLVDDRTPATGQAKPATVASARRWTCAWSTTSAS